MKTEIDLFGLTSSIAHWISEPHPEPPVEPGEPVYLTLVGTIDGEPTNYAATVGFPDGTRHTEWHDF